MISDDTITSYLSALFGNSEPGAVMCNMMTAEVGRTKAGTLDTEPQVKWWAIAPDSPDVSSLIAKTLLVAASESANSNTTMVFVGLTREDLAVDIESIGPESREVARRLRAEGRLDEHPAAFEVTRLYATCWDGRRWIGEHYLTGQRAGQVDGPRLLTGPVQRTETARIRHMMRAMVGI